VLTSSHVVHPHDQHQGVLVGFVGWGPDYWDVGQISLRCLAVAPAGKRFTASVKAIGNREPPTV
jgi:hypothetical protein